MYEHIMYSPHVCIAYVYGTWMNVDEWNTSMIVTTIHLFLNGM